MNLLSIVCLFFSAGLSPAQNHQPRWKPGASSEFEVCTQLRAWTIQDEGMETIFENCRSMAGINNIYFLAIMHQEHRPFKADKFPHNPRRSTFQAEDSRVAFFPEEERYGKIKPARSDHEWIRKTDWLQLTIEECRKRGMGVGTEVSHFPIPKAMLSENPDWLQKDVHGRTLNKTQFCPNHPDVREYLLALYGDLAANYDLDYIQTCQYVFAPSEPDEGGGCFCEHCIKEAALHGTDLEAITPVLKQDAKAEPERSIWIGNRCRVAAELFEDLAAVIRNENPQCHLRLNDVYSWRGRDPLMRGMDIKAIGKHIGSLVNQDHTEQLGEPEDNFAARKEWLTTNRAHIGPDKPFLTGIAARMEASPELVRRGIKVAVQHPAGIDGLALKHYDGASFSLLRAFRQGMIEAGVRGLTPALGMEVEAMDLAGYEVFNEELAEEWGVETRRKGEASGSFDHPSGYYDVRITYFDSKKGESPVRLFIEGKEVASFRMDENTDCWRWKKFRKISISKGDRILLAGENHSGEKARLDFIEFIPVGTGGDD